MKSNSHLSIAIALLLGVTTYSFEGKSQVVALGASNTEGKGVGRDQAFPAQLQAMLHAKGYNVTVINAGVSGDTPEGMLNRLGSAVPVGTKVVILNPGGNDLRACKRQGGECATRGEHEAVVSQIRSQLRGRGIKVVMAKFGGISDQDRQSDGRHLTAETHRGIAAQLLPQVMSALGAPGR